MDKDKSEDEFLTLKNRGNEQFKLKNYDEAISYYSSAINVKNDEAVAYSNRAICYIHIKDYFKAKEDCDKAISLDSTLSKAYYRRATAMRELCRFDKAIEDLENLLSLEPSSTLAEKELKEIRNLINQDQRISLEPMSKPEKFRSNKPIKMFDLNNHYYGTKSYGSS